MNKLAQLLHWLFANPIALLIVFYFYWFISTPLALIAWGAILIVFYLTPIVLQRLFNRIRFLSIIFLIAAFIINLLSVFYALLAISLIIDYGVENLTCGFALVVGISSIIFATHKKITGNNELYSKIMFVVALPLLSLIVFYFAIFYPTVVDTANISKFKYYVTRELNDDFYNHINFYKCKRGGFSCDVLYSSLGWGDTKIIVDEEKGEVSLYENSTLKYTNGTNSRYYQGYDASLGNYLYLLGWTCNEVNFTDCEDVAYILYQCELDFKSCDPLPIQYTSYYDNYSLALDANQLTGEISLFEDFDDSSTLIFIYGKNPRCYVDGCEILEK